MSESDFKTDLLYMMVYDTVHEVGIGYMAAELHAGVFPGEINTCIHSDIITIGPDEIISDSTVIGLVKDTINKVIEEVRTSFNETFVILLSKTFTNIQVKIILSAYEIVSFDSMLIYPKRYILETIHN